MINILSIVADILAMPNVFEGILPNSPDTLVALFEYASTPPAQYFGSTDYVYNMQARTRAVESTDAYNLAVQVQDKLNGYEDATFVISQVSNILGIGQDSHDPARQEYTINFKIIMKG